ncbi:thioesterase family protein [Janibacter sp. YIM B02568]|uniref:thioesterase family protein n=1 Tax=Janibacter endophyticus TaxID=2806261 RepID=UPI00194EB344|nr:thioesterase family protein [Janibacter endophyticus]MBM6545448.1 thioesterase family protein [Janibacter endophyticus]
MSKRMAVAEARTLPAAMSLIVPDTYADANGHMNIVHHMQVHNDAGWRYVERFGLGERHAREGSAASFDVQHHINYLAEVVVGDKLTVHVRLLQRTTKALHLVQVIVDDTTDVVANTLEIISLGVDLATRRVAPFPPHVTEALDAQLALDQALDWEFLGSSDMGLRA